MKAPRVVLSIVSLALLPGIGRAAELSTAAQSHAGLGDSAYTENARKANSSSNKSDPLHASHPTGLSGSGSPKKLNHPNQVRQNPASSRSENRRPEVSTTTKQPVSPNPRVGKVVVARSRPNRYVSAGISGEPLGGRRAAAASIGGNTNSPRNTAAIDGSSMSRRHTK
jgi:hypothetical protein